MFLDKGAAPFVKGGLTFGNPRQPKGRSNEGWMPFKCIQAERFAGKVGRLFTLIYRHRSTFLAGNLKK